MLKINNRIPENLKQKIQNQDESIKDDQIIQSLQEKLKTKENLDTIKQYADKINNPIPPAGKQLLNNGENKTPKFELLDLLTFGITYLLKLLFQGKKDYEEFKQTEPKIAHNCKMNGIDYVKDNEKDSIKEVTHGIGLYHDLNDLNKQLALDKNNSQILKIATSKKEELSRLCTKNKTLNNLIHSNSDCCALANGLFHVGLFASKINQREEKEFFLIDQGGRNIPGSGFPSDEVLSKKGINVMEVASTNGMCIATANAGLQYISSNGLDAYLNNYAGL